MIITAPDWLGDARNVDGICSPEENVRVADSSLCWGKGRLEFDIDRTLLKTDLMIRPAFVGSADIDFIFQLLDKNGRVVAIELFSNSNTVAEEAVTAAITGFKSAKSQRREGEYEF